MDRYEWCGVEPGSEVKNVIIKYCIFAFENIKYLHKTQEGYIKINTEKVHLNIQIIFKVLIFYYLLPFT